MILMVVYSDQYVEHLTVTVIDCKKVLERQTTKGYDPTDHVMYIYKNMYTINAVQHFVSCKKIKKTKYINVFIYIWLLI